MRENVVPEFMQLVAGQRAFFYDAEVGLGFDSKVSPTFFPEVFQTGRRLVGEGQVELVQ